MLFISKTTFALLTFRERKLAHQASFLWPLGLGGLFYFQGKEVSPEGFPSFITFIADGLQ